MHELIFQILNCGLLVFDCTKSGKTFLSHEAMHLVLYLITLAVANERYINPQIEFVAIQQEWLVNIPLD